MKIRTLGFVLISAVWLAGCGSATDQPGNPPLISIRPDPNYVAKPKDVAVLLCPFDPASRVPCVRDLDVYHRIYEHLRRGQRELISPDDLAQIRWAPPGAKVEVLNVQDQKSVDASNDMDRQVAESDPTYFGSNGHTRVYRKPWAKVDRFDPDATGLPLSERMGFTPIEFVVRPLP